METYYLIFVVALFLLAAFDLMVGVSNDAVNFLNSAIGSRVARWRTIMIVASVGIVLGAVASSGMMEVARKGIFNPGHYTFEEIMMLFVAVMLTDIILLDIFNTIGLPTSTTVSIVFELLGAAVMVALYHVTVKEDIGLTHVGEYINGDSAITIISGILLSVLIAFTVGAIVMYVSRLIYTFRYQRRQPYVGAIWAGIAFMAISYFILIKGLKGSPMVPDNVDEFIHSHPYLTLLGLFVLWTVIMQLLMSVFKQNILRLVVLAGTFALAMAFAGNDLVNFIGVPVAGYQSYVQWEGSGQEAGDFMMTALEADGKGVKFGVNVWMLLGAGLIMVATLWLSRKARTVTETELKLARQSEHADRFRPTWLSRVIVRTSTYIAGGINTFLPAGLRRRIDDSFAPIPANEQEANPPAFDLIRASVNLTVASILISIATSMKLPLSTTYVTFMVAMGTSLADRAWGRDSAVYRVAGVITVIGGWFMTALSAFVAAALVALVLLLFGMYGFVAMVLVALGLLLKNHISHLIQHRAEAERERLENEDTVLSEKFVANTRDEVRSLLLQTRKTYLKAINALITEDETQLKSIKKRAGKLNKRTITLQDSIYSRLKKLPDSDGGYSEWYLSILHRQADVQQTTMNVVDYCLNHVANVHNPLKEEQSQELQAVAELVRKYFGVLQKGLVNQDHEMNLKSVELQEDAAREIGMRIREQVKGIKNGDYGRRNSLLYLSLLMETHDLLNHSKAISGLFHLSVPSDETPLLGNEQEE